MRFVTRWPRAGLIDCPSDADLLTETCGIAPTVYKQEMAVVLHEPSTCSSHEGV